MAGRKESTDLFQLIKSLPPEEKGYFRKFAKRHSDKGSSALKLFDEISKQKNYDEKLLKKKFSDLPVRKQQLFENIMQSLVVSYNQPEGKIPFLKVLMEIELLKQKKLFDRALQIINKYLPIARRTGILFFEEELLRMWNYHLLAKSDGRSRLKQQLEYEELYAEFVRRKENMDLMITANQMLYAIDIISMQEPDNFPDPDEYVDISFMQEPKNALTPMADTARRINLTIYYDIKGDKENYYQLRKQVFTEARKQKEKDGKYNELYVRALRGVIYAAIESRRFNEANKLFQLHKPYKMIGKWMQEEHELVNNMMQQYIYWRSGKHAEGLKFSNEVLKKVDYPNLSELYYIFVKSFFQHKILFEFSVGTPLAVQMNINTLHSLLSKEDTPVVDKYSEIIKALVQIKHNNLPLVPALVNNLTRSRAGKALRVREKEFLDTLKTINGVNKKNVLVKLWNEYHKPSNEFFLYGYQQIGPVLKSLYTNNTLSELLAAEQID